MALFIYRKIEKGELQLKYSFPWYIIIILLILLTIFDNVLIPIRDFLGFQEVSNMIFLIGFLGIAMLVFSLNVKFSILNSKVIRLTQENAILKKEVKENGKNKRSNN